MNIYIAILLLLQNTQIYKDEAFGISHAVDINLNFEVWIFGGTVKY